MKIECSFVSVWDGGTIIETPAVVDTTTGEIDTTSADVDGAGLDVLDREYINVRIDGKPVHFDAEGDVLPSAELGALVGALGKTHDPQVEEQTIWVVTSDTEKGFETELFYGEQDAFEYYKKAVSRYDKTGVLGDDPTYDDLLNFMYDQAGEPNMITFDCLTPRADSSHQQAQKVEIDNSPVSDAAEPTEGEDMYEVAITATITRKIKVSASDEDEAVDLANEIFSTNGLTSDDYYSETVDSIRKVDHPLFELDKSSAFNNAEPAASLRM